MSLAATAALASALAIPAHADFQRDFTGDGNPDLIVKDSHDNLWLYPGDGDGGFKPRIKSGTGWHFTAIFESDGEFNGVFARDKSGTLWAYPSDLHGGWDKPMRVGTGWNQMTSIIQESGQSDLLAIDPSGTLWRYPYWGNDPIHWLPRQRVGHGWAGYMLVSMHIGGGWPEFYARDTHGTLWPYFDNGKTIHRARYNLGGEWNQYTRIVYDGDFENVDGLFDLIATDTHGNLWYYPSRDLAPGHRVIIGHGFTGYTVY